MKTLKVINWRSMGLNDRARIIVNFFQQFFELEDFNSEMSYKFFVNGGDLIGISVDGEYYEVDLSKAEATDNEKMPDGEVWAEKIIEKINPLPEMYNIWLDWSIHKLSSSELRNWNNGIREYVIGKDLFESPEQALLHKETMKNPDLSKVWVLYHNWNHQTKLVIGSMTVEETYPSEYYGRVQGVEYSLEKHVGVEEAEIKSFSNSENGFILPVSFDTEEEALKHAMEQGLVPLHVFRPKNWEEEEDVRESVHSWGEYHD